MTKTKLTARRHRLDDDRRYICRNKIRFKSIREAWEKASFYYALYRGRDKYRVYECTAGSTKPHYHLTTKLLKGINKYGKGNFAPPDYILDLFNTPIVKKVTWWQKILRWFSCG